MHIEGTLEPDHMFALAKRNNIQIPFNNINDVKKILSSRKLSANSVIDGKPLLVHAVLSDNPNIVNLLVRYGAQPFTDVCSEGLNAMEWSIKSNSYFARAELIVIKILHN